MLGLTYGPFQLSTPVGCTISECRPSSVVGYRPVSRRNGVNEVRIAVRSACVLAMRLASAGLAGAGLVPGAPGTFAAPGPAPAFGANSHFPAAFLRRAPTDIMPTPCSGVVVARSS